MTHMLGEPAAWHRAVIEAERDLSAYFARWSRVHPPVPESGSSRLQVAALAATLAATGWMPIRRR